MTIQCDSVPRGASWNPKPRCSPFGKTGGLKMVVSPLPMLAASSPQCFLAVSEMTHVRIMRAACRPRVEWRTAGESFVFATAPAVSRVLTAQRFVGSWPSANPTSTCASGPTCIGLFWKRGALTHEYFFVSSKVVYFGSVVSSYGCFCQSPSYQECAIDSLTFSLKYGSSNDLISRTVARSPL